MQATRMTLYRKTRYIYRNTDDVIAINNYGRLIMSGRIMSNMRDPKLAPRNVLR